MVQRRAGPFRSGGGKEPGQVPGDGGARRVAARVRPAAGIYGYTHAFGGYAGAHAQYVRVPHADNDCFPVPDGLPDEQALFLSDAAPTGYMGADFWDIRPGDVVAVWGCGGVGLMAIRSAYLLGAERVIGIDRFPERLQMAREKAGAETISYVGVDSVLETLREMTGPA